jgi:hypothetical protein
VATAATNTSSPSTSNEASQAIKQLIKAPNQVVDKAAAEAIRVGGKGRHRQP